MAAVPGPDAMMQQWLQAAQAMIGSGGTMPDALAARTSLPPDVVTLQQQWLTGHAELWGSFVDGTAGSLAPAAGRDRRFADPAWAESPIYDYLRQAYLHNAQFLQRLADLVPAADEQSAQRLRFLTKQYVDALSPSNFAATNPEFIKRALETKGESIRQGILNLIADLERGRISMTDHAAFEVGRNLAVTPGAVVFENELFQLIQYAPTTAKVAQRPLVMIPPCINKYYILDLQPHNSFVRHAVAQGQTVFMVSWRNVKADNGHLTWDDYIESGVLRALDLGAEIAAVDQVNALGFCVGGTLLASALAVAKVRGKAPVKSLTLLTTLLDFSIPGELGCLVDDAVLRAREAVSGDSGIFPGRDFAAVFSSLRPNDLVWQYVVGNYLMGRQPPALDLLFWNADSTNLPIPFLTWYLRNMYLANRLAQPGLEMCGVPVALSQVDMPAFVLATREDHIVPWQGAFLSQTLLGGETTFVLGASGHIAGVINPQAAGRRSHWVNSGPTDDAAKWLGNASEMPGSWWLRWSEWLAGHGGPQVAARKRLGSAHHPAIEAAPGRYVMERA